MPAHRINTRAPLDFAALRAELGVPGEFPAEVLAAAAEAARAPDRPAVDRSEIPFVTVDPPGSRDLDQAVHIAASDGGYLVSYAIADVAAFVVAGGRLDAEARRRVETLYFPDARVPLHPPALSEGAASLLPNEVRPAVLWQITLDGRGEVVSTSVGRALVRSRQQLEYQQLQAMHNSATAPEAVALLAEVGVKRLALSRARHAINLDLPEQEVVPDGSGGWRLVFRSVLDVERYNAEISLLTGMCAATLMLEHGIGILRTLPAPDTGAIERMRRIAGPLGVSWPRGAAPGDVLAPVDRSQPRHLAFVEQAASLLRGAGYTAFDGAPPAQRDHAGVGAPYAHVTAPLRRLVDRFGSSLCAALGSGEPVPDWVRAALPTLPKAMQDGDRLAHACDRAVVDTVEAWLLQDRVGDVFDAIVVDASGDGGRLSIDEPPVRASFRGAGRVDGEAVKVRLVSADLARRKVDFEVV